jgi:hypothetical protein
MLDGARAPMASAEGDAAASGTAAGGTVGESARAFSGRAAAATPERSVDARPETSAPAPPTASEPTAGVSAARAFARVKDAAPWGGAPEPLIDATPEWFGRLASVARAVAGALTELDGPMPSRGRLARDLGDLAAQLDVLARASRTQLAGEPLSRADRLALEDPLPFCERFLPGPTAAATVIAVLDPGTEGGRARVRQRVVTGFDTVLALTRAPGGAPDGLALGRGVVLRVRELTSERRIEPAEAPSLTPLGPPGWAAPLYGDEAGGR